MTWQLLSKKAFNRGWLTVPEDCLLSHGLEHGGTQADMITDSFTARSKGSKKREGLRLNGLVETSTHPQGHISSSKAMPTPKGHSPNLS